MLAIASEPAGSPPASAPAPADAGRAEGEGGGGAAPGPTAVVALRAVAAALSDDFDTADEAHTMVARVRQLLTQQLTEAGWSGE